MPLKSVHHFQGCSAGVEDVTNAEDEIEARVIIITDLREGTQYRYPMGVEAAKVLGGQLMGLKDVQVADEAELRKLLNPNGGRHS